MSIKIKQSDSPRNIKKMSIKQSDSEHQISAGFIQTSNGPKIFYEAITPRISTVECEGNAPTDNIALVGDILYGYRGSNTLTEYDWDWRRSSNSDMSSSTSLDSGTELNVGDTCQNRGPIQPTTQVDNKYYQIWINEVGDTDTPYKSNIVHVVRYQPQFASGYSPVLSGTGISGSNVTAGTQITVAFGFVRTRSGGYTDDTTPATSQVEWLNNGLPIDGAGTTFTETDGISAYTHSNSYTIPLTMTGTISARVTLINSNPAYTESTTNELTISPITPPSAPTNLTLVEATTNSLAIGWSEPISNGGSAITDYESKIQQGGTIVSDWISLGISSPGVVTWSPLTINQSYTVYIRAVNIAGKGTADSITASTLNCVVGCGSWENDGSPTYDSCSPISCTRLVTQRQRRSCTYSDCTTGYEYQDIQYYESCTVTKSCEPWINDGDPTYGGCSNCQQTVYQPQKRYCQFSNCSYGWETRTYVYTQSCSCPNVCGAYYDVGSPTYGSCSTSTCTRTVTQPTQRDCVNSCCNGYTQSSSRTYSESCTISPYCNPVVYGTWSSWSACVNCTQTRSRWNSQTCYDAYCVGGTTYTQETESQTCTVTGYCEDCVSSEPWTYTACSCGGYQDRYRSGTQLCHTASCGTYTQSCQIYESNIHTGCTCSPSQICGSWSSCVNHTQSRTCYSIDQYCCSGSSYQQTQSCDCCTSTSLSYGTSPRSCTYTTCSSGSQSVYYNMVSTSCGSFFAGWAGTAYWSCCGVC